MMLRECVAKAMYEAPAYGGPGGVWPPRRPEDLEYWLTRADAAMSEIVDWPSQLLVPRNDETKGAGP